MAEICSHLDTITVDKPASTPGCEECLANGTQWLHLRVCRNCGHIGCCDSSPMKHASAHAASSEHPVISSMEPGENWTYCYVDDVAFVLPGE
jgi:hypothetical protein